MCADHREPAALVVEKLKRALGRVQDLRPNLPDESAVSPMASLHEVVCKTGGGGVRRSLASAWVVKARASTVIPGDPPALPGTAEHRMRPNPPNSE